ncbi:hypothetical protein PV729_25905 [Streptomyces europaeiscabiei]|uniref:Uncharacterized protein n=1 Tax=Streptomyces europaeiscabiei TaxID=146819 RepID=A0ABU4NUF5_9ACTN|nr:hypothetical protein [Streptomyces europaeiscabiei]MDX3548790.1 hypothetical protein [Streptomyces europaeiscabiei]MDX3555156.1 hypothetical protein [Streptomyces europaeiscabiei]MDX3705170.1 hypothetical protein [Streptomyces europaeiscabiei]
MTTRPHPPLKSLTPTTTGPRTAEPATPPTAVGEPTGAARKGARTALRPDPRRDDGRRPVAWLHIVAPPSWSVTPSARSWCTCGYERQAIGRAAVLQLIAAHGEHHISCPLLNPVSEGRAAA